MLNLLSGKSIANVEDDYEEGDAEYRELLKKGKGKEKAKGKGKGSDGGRKPERKRKAKHNVEVNQEETTVKNMADAMLVEDDETNSETCFDKSAVDTSNSCTTVKHPRTASERDALTDLGTTTTDGGATSEWTEDEWTGVQASEPESAGFADGEATDAESNRQSMSLSIACISC